MDTVKLVLKNRRVFRLNNKGLVKTRFEYVGNVKGVFVLRDTENDTYRHVIAHAVSDKILVVHKYVDGVLAD